MNETMIKNEFSFLVKKDRFNRNRHYIIFKNICLIGYNGYGYVSEMAAYSMAFAHISKNGGIVI